MNKLLLAALIVFVLCFQAFSQFNPADAEKSVVKVMVSKEGESASVLSGFIWKKGEWIVTSLHGMKPGFNITVQYLNKYWRSATIIKLYKEADLVLLEVEAGKVPPGVVAIPDFRGSQLTYSEDIIALGYNSNSKSSSTRKMSKGHVNPENLASLLPDSLLPRLKSSGIPYVELDIIYLEGSLLPGYSGSPAYDKDGKLIGIGDGGLDGGASNVSWVIPAKFLTNLENSPVTKLPDDFDKLTMHFSAETRVDLSKKEFNDSMEKELTPEALEEIFAEEYPLLDFGDFELHYTKTRTFEEVLNTAYDVDNILTGVEEYKSMNMNIDYDRLTFDFYEDAISGIVIAVPQGVNLVAVEEAEENVFSADLTELPENEFFEMYFAGTKNKEDLTGKDEIFDDLYNNIDNFRGGEEVGGFTMVEDASFHIDIDEDRRIGWFLFFGNNAIEDDNGSSFQLILYITLLVDSEKAFFSVASLKGPVDYGERVEEYGINCVEIEGYDKTPVLCDYFELYLHLICSVHLTTFANTQVVRSNE